MSEGEPAPFDRRGLVVWTAVLTVAFEIITIAARFALGVSAAEWIEANDPPLIMQIHHMFWGVPLLVAAAVLWRRPGAAMWLLAVGLALVLSDLSHHFIVLPMLVGNTGWHWP